MIRFRPFRNSDPPDLLRLWNRMVPEQGAVRPLRVHELDDHAFGSVCFDREGLIVAEQDGRIAGFVHAGFGPDQPIESTPPHSLCYMLGTIAMLAVESGLEHSGVDRQLILQAERYLRARGAKVLYAGNRFPLNPFYWGLYGGSEGSGVVSGHASFLGILSRMGYEAVSTTVSLEYELEIPEPRDPQAVVIRRHTRLETEEDALPSHWWENLSLSEFHLTRIRLIGRSDGADLARATTWDMSWFGRRDGRSRLGLIGLEVAAEHRRKGFGRYLVVEVLRSARELGTAVVEAQTASTNQPALALYQSIGFHQVDHSTLYRLPASLLDRSLST